MNLPFDSRSLSLFASLIVRLSPLPRRVQIAQEGRLLPDVQIPCIVLETPNLPLRENSQAISMLKKTRVTFYEASSWPAIAMCLPGVTFNAARFSADHPCARCRAVLFATA